MPDHPVTSSPDVIFGGCYREPPHEPVPIPIDLHVVSEVAYWVGCARIPGFDGEEAMGMLKAIIGFEDAPTRMAVAAALDQVGEMAIASLQFAAGEFRAGKTTRGRIVAKRVSALRSMVDRLSPPARSFRNIAYAFHLPPSPADDEAPF